MEHTWIKAPWLKVKRHVGLQGSSRLFSLWQKRFKVETEIENWLQKYDADMGEKQVWTPPVVPYVTQHPDPPPTPTPLPLQKLLKHSV